MRIWGMVVTTPWPKQLVPTREMHVDMKTNTSNADMRGRVIRRGNRLAWCITKPPRDSVYTLCTLTTRSSLVVTFMFKCARVLDIAPRPAEAGCIDKLKMLEHNNVFPDASVLQ